MIPIIISLIAYCERSDKSVVMVPAPAINGNAMGKTDAVSGMSSLEILMPRIISSEIKNKTNAPAIANDEISSPINFKILSPKKRKRSMINNDVRVAFSECMLPALLLISIIIGMEPIISMTANKIIETVSIFLKSIF